MSGEHQITLALLALLVAAGLAASLMIQDELRDLTAVVAGLEHRVERLEKTAPLRRQPAGVGKAIQWFVYP
jgi:hypothetical protein